jgi:hypothetical protein
MEPTRLRGFALLSILPLLAFAAYACFHGSDPLVTNDSPGYMYFGEDRTVGYPLFLAFIKMMFGNFEPVRLVQLGILCTSLMLLTWSFWITIGAFWAALLFEILLFGNPGLPLLANQIMADCMTAACISLFTALILLMRKASHSWVIWSLAIVTAFAILIRPVTIALFPASLAAILLFGHQIRIPRWVQALIVTVVVTGGYEATPAVHWLREEPIVASNPLARGLLQKTLFRQWPESTETNACDGALIAKDTAEVNEYLTHVPDIIRPHLMRSYSGYLRFMVIMPELAISHNATRMSGIDPILMCYDMARIKSDPLYFVKDAVRQFGDLLTYSTFISVQTQDEIDQYLAKHPPVIPAAVPRHDVDYQLRARAIEELRLDPGTFTHSDLHMRAPHARPILLMLGLSAFQIAGAITMALGLCALLSGAVTRRSHEALRIWFVIGTLGIAFYGMMVLTAIVEIALPRYVFPLWPLFCASVMLAFMSLMSHNRIRSSYPNSSSPN